MGYGPGSDHTINTNKPFAIITEFREKDGDLDGMYQYYMQGGKTIHPPDSGERGPCNPDHGDPKTLREKHPDTQFDVRHVRWGKIGTTHAATTASLKALESETTVV